MKRILAVCFLFTLICFPSIANAKSQEAIVLVAFGSSVKSGQKAYQQIEKAVRKQFPQHEIHWAWTAHSLLKQSTKPQRLSPQQVFANLATQGIKHVTVLTLHIIPGQEYNNLLTTANAFVGLPKGLTSIAVTPPLLYSSDGLIAVSKALLSIIPQERKPQEGLLFVGHGTHHHADIYYPALQFFLQQQDPLALVSTIEGKLDIEYVLQECKAKNITTLWLAPLMTVAGDHALNDLFGKEEDSWQNQLAQAGIQVRPLPKGLGEYPEFTNIWVKTLAEALD